MLKIFAPAKINLYLHITGKRTDGYHLLDSLICHADIGDHLYFEQSHQLNFSITGAFSHNLPQNQNNLVIKAANAFFDAANIAASASIILEKNLPPSSGIGSGSSDAAATLKGLQQLYNVKLDEAILRSICIKLGADVYMCMNNTPKFISGIGEEIASTTLPGFYLVLINPLTGISTLDIFASLKLADKYKSSVDNYNDFPNLGALIEFLKNKANDLADAAISFCSEIRDILELFNQQPKCLYQNLSGSGATCFGIFANYEDATAAAKNMALAKPSFWIKIGKIYE